MFRVETSCRFMGKGNKELFHGAIPYGDRPRGPPRGHRAQPQRSHLLLLDKVSSGSMGVTFRTFLSTKRSSG